MKRGFHDEGLAHAAAALERDAGATALDSRVTRPGTATIAVAAAGDCADPVGFQHTYTAPACDGRVTRPTAASLFIEGEGRCRRCEACLRARQVLWARRAASELKLAGRTWFGTLTLRPTEQQRLRDLARLRCSRSGVDFDAQTYAEQFRDVWRELGPQVTRYLKRVRKASACSLRYLCVVERHQSGDPHLHLLVHECAGTLVTKALLEQQWQLGFTRWKLADARPNLAWYLCKYLAKTNVARVRASKGYGSGLASKPARTTGTGALKLNSEASHTIPHTGGAK